MLHSIIAGALRQRLILVVVAVVLVGFGINAAEHLSVDAFPDVANVQVQIATEAPGKSPEEVERFVTIPIEIAMTGLPGMTDMRSLNKPGLSLITLVFTDSSDLFRERQMISERLSELRERMPEGVTPVLGLDVYEHAYYADFFTARAGYIDEFLQFVDYSAVNALLPKS